jgi:VCBS repeat-containing protein
MPDVASFSVTESNAESDTQLTGQFSVNGVPVTVIGVARAGQAQTGVGADIDGLYGAISVAANGSFEYILDNQAAATDLLTSGMVAQERFTLTYLAGGVMHSAQLVIDVHGFDEFDQTVIDSAPVIYIADPLEISADQVVHASVRSESPYADANDVLENHGVIHTIVAESLQDTYPNAVAVEINGQIHNDGLIVSEAHSTNLSQAIGASLPSFGSIAVNDGIIRAIALGPRAQAEGLGSGAPSSTIVNNGVIESISDAEAWALRPDHVFIHVENNGLIYAQGNLGADDWAYGVAAIRTGQFSGYQIENNGIVQAVVPEGSQASIGILIFAGNVNIHSYGTIHNSGLIVADTAITVNNAGYYDQIRVINDGEIQGDLLLHRNYNSVFNNAGAIWLGDLHFGTDVDILNNSGVVDGTIDMGDGVDFYLGAGQVSETIAGGGDADFLRGGSQADILSGGAGSDLIAGGGGADVLTGGTGADVFAFHGFGDSTAAASDTIQDFETGIDKIDLSGLDLTSISLVGSGGITTLTGSTSAGQIVIRVQGSMVTSDVIFGMNASGLAVQNDNLFYGYGTAGLAINGNAGDDFIVGTSGDDRLDGRAGADILAGGVGDDIYLTDDLLDRAVEMADEGNDTVYSSSNFAILLDNVENLYLQNGIEAAGNDLDNLIVANDQDNSLYGRGGNDRLYGYAGDDVYYVDSMGDLVFEDVGGGMDMVVAQASYYLHQNVENATLLSQLDTFLTSYTISTDQDYFLVGNELGNHLSGNFGDNLIIGGLGNDVLIGDRGNDSLFGEDGSDSIEGGLGIDYLVGGTGDDFLRGGSGADAVYGGEGNDILIAEREPVWDPISGSGRPLGEEDFVTDILVGGAGDDSLYANSGLGDYDLLDGGSGNDTYYVDTPDDLTFEAAGGGTDTVYADIDGAGYYLYAHTENLVLLGDTPFGVGNELANRLTGNAAANYLLGGAGDDRLDGQAGNDVLFGEDGADIFVFEAGTGGDVIGDFAGGTDKIDLSDFGFANFAALQGRFSQVGADGAIDLGGGDFIVLNGVTMSGLTAGDFVLSAVADKSDGFGRHDTAPASLGDDGAVTLAAIASHFLSDGAVLQGAHANQGEPGTFIELYPSRPFASDFADWM